MSAPGGKTTSKAAGTAADAASTEFALAALFDDSSNGVQWWLRCYGSGDVWIELDSGRRYYPDFIVLDSDGVYWVVEGKSDRDARDSEVLEKRRAAEEWARQIRDQAEFGTWRYVFATESNIKKSKSWEELLVHTKPER
jgi:type III restriction enzyme